MSFVGFELEDGYLKKLENYIQLNKLEENIVFYDSDADKSKILDEAAFLIHPSKNEGFGIVVIEAQAVGNICFVSDSVPHEVDCGGCKFFSINESPAMVAEMIIEKYNKEYGMHYYFDCQDMTSKSFINIIESIYKGQEK